ncbi:protein Spindly-B-like [Diadema antillarum]|uniref:protein Spindly-B-like n=1 Tax=Diadema antillarum TaxID=105358 RepID=UPI003A8A3B5D
MDTLESRVEELRQELREKDANLHKAATIGKQLLEENHKLEQQNEDLVNEYTAQIRDLEQEKYTLQMQLANKEHLEQYHATELKCLQESKEKETAAVREQMELKHSLELKKLRATSEAFQSDLEHGRIENEQLREKLKISESALKDALDKANATILEQTMSAEDRMYAVQEENNTLTAEKMELSARLKESKDEVEQLHYAKHMLTQQNAELESRADEEHTQCLTYFRNLQEVRTQVQELQAELDLIKLQSTDPNSKGNSLFAEVEDKRQALEKKMIGMQLNLDAAKKQLTHKKQQIQNLKYQIAGLLQMDRGGAAASQVEQLEQLLAQSRTDVQNLTQKLHNVQSHQKSSGIVLEDCGGAPESPSRDRLKRFYQSKLDQAGKEKENVEKELQSQRMQRMFLSDRLVECQRNLYASEKRVQQLQSTLIVKGVKIDELRAKLTEHGIAVDKEVKGGYKERIPGPDDFVTKKPEPKEGSDSKPLQALPGDSGEMITKGSKSGVRPSESMRGASRADRDGSNPAGREPLGEPMTNRPSIPPADGDKPPRKKVVSISSKVTDMEDEEAFHGSGKHCAADGEENTMEGENRRKRKEATAEDGRSKGPRVRGPCGGRLAVPTMIRKDCPDECKQQ